MKVTTKIFSIIVISVLLISPFITFKKVGQIENRVERIQKNLLEYSLTTLGDKLFSLVGDWDGKKNLKERYDAFVQRAVNGHANQDQIENIAADILNVTNQENTIQPYAAIDILKVMDFDHGPLDFSQCDGQLQMTVMSHSETTSLGESLVKILEVNDNLKKSCNKKYPSHNFGQKVSYESDRGIVMILQDDIKGTLNPKDYEKMLQELHEMNGMFQVEWKKSVACGTIEQGSALCNQLDKAKEIKLMYLETENIDVENDISLSMQTQLIP